MINYVEKISDEYFDSICLYSNNKCVFEGTDFGSMKSVLNKFGVSESLVYSDSMNELINCFPNTTAKKYFNIVLNA
jgi:hypothetical protein